MTHKSNPKFLPPEKGPKEYQAEIDELKKQLNEIYTKYPSIKHEILGNHKNG